MTDSIIPFPTGLPDTAQDLERSVCKNRSGWFALRHKKDGWWVGKEDGVTCYETRTLAMVALTIIWRMDGGGVLNFEIQPFTQATHRSDQDYVTDMDGETAIRLYEGEE
jgi:hypothetical protein